MDWRNWSSTSRKPIPLESSPTPSLSFPAPPPAPRAPPPPQPAHSDAPLGAGTAETTLRIGHAFINDMAASAAPFNAFGAALTADTDVVIGGTRPAGTYD